ncbi:MAG: DUF4394 domain-containing protein [bacterium]
MIKVKFLIATLALFFIAGCEKDNQVLSPIGQADEEVNVLAKDGDRRSPGQRLYAITSRNRLIQFDSNEPDDIISKRRVTGLQSNERLLGIDFRPANGKLYGLGSSSRLYVIDLQTGVATPVGGGPFSPALQGKVFGFDFNPTVDRIRVVSDAGQNLRLHPDLGTVVDFDPNTAGIQPDLNLVYDNTAADGDPVDVNAGRQPRVAGAAYTNPDNNPATGTTLYDLDTRLDVLVIQNPPNNGVLNTVGSLRRNAERLLGFDIAASGVAYAAWAEDDDDDDNRLVTIDLTTGRASKLGEIDTDGGSITGLAAPIP